MVQVGRDGCNSDACIGRGVRGWVPDQTQGDAVVWYGVGWGEGGHSVIAQTPAGPVCSPRVSAAFIYTSPLMHREHQTVRKYSMNGAFGSFYGVKVHTTVRLSRTS